MANVLLLEDLDRRLSERGLSQLERARVLTFNFSEGSVKTACEHWGSQSLCSQLLEIIKFKGLLSLENEPLTSFFEQTGKLYGKDFSGISATFQPTQKVGMHLSSSAKFLSSKNEFVSLNELDYYVKEGDWYVQTINPDFSFINAKEGKYFLYTDSFDLNLLKRLKDLKFFSEKEIIHKTRGTFIVVKV